MPKGKNAFFRYRIIDRCLRDHNHKWSKKDILEAVNKEIRTKSGESFEVTESAIRHDLDAIEFEFSAPIERYPANRPRYYRYEDPNYSLFQTEISPRDISKLQRVVNILESIKGLDLAEEVEPIVKFLQNRSLASSKQTRVLHLDHRPISDGYELIEDFLSSIIEKTVLEFLYQPFLEKTALKVVLSPYLIKEFNNRWYVIGYCSAHKKIMHIGLDRIKEKLKISKADYVENSFLDTETYFEDIIGITKPIGKEKEVIRLAFSANRAPFVLTKPLHKSQRLIKTDKKGNSIFEIEVIPNKELFALLLSFGSDIQIISPKELREQFLQDLKKAVAKY